jgi:hypothetical protein
MDVALDANIILNDPRMEGNAFQSLLDYLRMTNSRLVLSKVVIDEVIARYPERLKSKIKDASRAVGILKGIVVGSEIDLPFIEVDRETRLLEQRLLKPSKSIEASHLVNNYSEIQIEEIVKRGIQRIPPANAAGEELRDVIHWLLILEHLRQSNSDLAFITADKHFQQEAALLPCLAQEIRDGHLPLHFYVSLDDFIKANSPAPHNLSETDAFSLLGKTHVLDRFEIEARPFLNASLASGRIVEREARLIRGALYDVGPESQFGELEFDAEMTSRVITEVPIVNSILGYSPFTEEAMPGVNYLVPGGLNAQLNFDDSGDWWKGPPIVSPIGLPIKGTIIEGAMRVPPADTHDYFVPSISDYASASFILAPHHSGTSTESSSEFHIAGSIVISLRAVSGKIINVQTERVEVNRIEKIVEAR